MTEKEGFVAYIAAHNKGVIKVFWFSLLELFLVVNLSFTVYGQFKFCHCIGVSAAVLPLNFYFWDDSTLHLYDRNNITFIMECF